MGIKKNWLRLKRKWRVYFKEDFKPASNRLQRFDHWATIFGLIFSSYFAGWSIWLSIKQENNDHSIDSLAAIAKNQKVQTDTLIRILEALKMQNKQNDIQLKILLKNQGITDNISLVNGGEFYDELMNNMRFAYDSSSFFNNPVTYRIQTLNTLKNTLTSGLKNNYWMQHKDFQKSSSAIISFIDIWIDALTNNSSFEREFYLEGKRVNLFPIQNDGKNYLELKKLLNDLDIVLDKGINLRKRSLEKIKITDGVSKFDVFISH